MAIRVRPRILASLPLTTIEQKVGRKQKVGR